MKYCPNPECPHLLNTGSAPEYIDEIQNCANCGTELLDGEAPTEIEEQDEIVVDSPLVIIATFSDVHSAYFAKSLIESAGIPVFLRDEHIVSINTLYSPAIGGVKLTVPSSQAEIALAIIQNEQPEPEQQTPPQQVSDEPEFIESEEQCPRCKSDKIITINAYLKRGVFSLLLGILFKLSGKKYKCQTCDYKWK